MNDYFTKKDAEEFKEDIKRYMGILVEDFQHRLNLVVDAQLDIKKDIAGLKEDVSGLKEDVAELKAKTDMIHNELIAHRGNTEVHAQKIKRKKKADA